MILFSSTLLLLLLLGNWSFLIFLILIFSVFSYSNSFPLINSSLILIIPVLMPFISFIFNKLVLLGLTLLLYVFTLYCTSLYGLYGTISLFTVFIVNVLGKCEVTLSTTNFEHLFLLSLLYFESFEFLLELYCSESVSINISLFL